MALQDAYFLRDAMIIFSLGNPKTVEELTNREFVIGKFVFKRDDFRFGLYLGEFNTHPELVKGLKLVNRGETEYSVIWGGGRFEINHKILKFAGSSGNYGQVPNSFLIDCCRNVAIPNIERFVFRLSPYSIEDPLLEERKKTWGKLGNYKLEVEMKSYEFDKNMNLIN